MKTIKIMIYIVLAIGLFNFSLYEVLFVADWYYIDGMYIYWLIIPALAIALMYTIHRWLFKQEKAHWLVVSFVINFVLMSSVAYIKDISTPSDDFFINIVFPVYLISSSVAFLMSILVAIVAKDKINNMGRINEDRDEGTEFLIGNDVKHLSFKKNIHQVMLTIAVFHFCFYTIIYTTSWLIPYSYTAWIIAPMTIALLIAILESRHKRYWRDRNIIIGLALCILIWGTILAFEAMWGFINQGVEQTTTAAIVTFIIIAVYALVKWGTLKNKTGS